jgi:hypothetical protein
MRRRSRDGRSQADTSAEEVAVNVWNSMPFARRDADPRLDRNLGREYNRYMHAIDDEDWMVFLDHDMQFTTKHWQDQIAEAIAFKPDAGAFTAVANRMGAPWQKVGGKEMEECHDMERHYAFGEDRVKVRTLLDVTETKGFGGVVIVLSKAAWRRAGGFADGLLCVDHSMFFALRSKGLRSYVIEGLYVYHRRRAFAGGELPKDTPRAANCLCRGDEKMPTVRLTLPGRAAA